MVTAETRSTPPIRYTTCICCLPQSLKQDALVRQDLYPLAADALGRVMVRKGLYISQTTCHQQHANALRQPQPKMVSATETVQEESIEKLNIYFSANIFFVQTMKTCLI